MLKKLGLVALVLGACNSGGVGGVMKEYADAVCDCKTADCLQQVQTKYQERLSKMTGSEATPDNAAELQKAAEQMKRVGECSRKIMMDAVPK